MWQHVAALVAEWGADLVGEHGLSAVGAVVGATHPRAVGEARKLMPQAVLLLPGVGAQGATPGRPRPRVHERPGERARQRVALGDLRLPRGRRATSAPRPAPRRRGCGRRYGRSRAGSRHRSAPWRSSRRARPRSCSPRRSSIAVVRAELHDGGSTATHAPADAGRARRRRRAPRAAPRVYVVRAGDTLDAIAAADGRPAGAAPRAEPEGRADGALHRREAPPAMRLRSLAAAASRRPAASAVLRRPAGAAAGADARAWLVENPAPARCSPRHAARDADADRVDHEADDRARRARPPEARATSSRRSARRRRRAGVDLPRAPARQITVARPRRRAR